MKQVVRLLMTVLSVFALSCKTVPHINVGLVTLTDAPSADAEAALSWMESEPTLRPVPLKPGESADVDCYWVHLPDSAAYALWQQGAGPAWFAKTAMKTPCLLTGYAAYLPNDAGFESRRPELSREDLKEDWLFDQKGLQSRGHHPIFKDFGGGVFIWDAFEDQTLETIGYFQDDFPEQGLVVAVEKAYVTVWGDRRLLIEHRPGEARLMSLGGLVHFDRSNRLDGHLKSFMLQLLRYTVRTKMHLGQFWPDFDFTPLSFEPHAFNPGAVATPLPDPLPQSGPLMKRDESTDAEYDLAGRRMLVMGKERGGIDELWVHPFRIARDVQAGVVSGDTVAWLRHLPCRIEVRPESMIREYETPAGTIREIVLASQDEGAALLRYQSAAGTPVEMVMTLASDLRWMWPYDEYALGPVCHGFDEKNGLLHVADEKQRFYALFGSDTQPISHIEGNWNKLILVNGRWGCHDADDNRIMHGALYKLDESNGFALNYVLAATNEGRWVTQHHFRNMLRHPGRSYQQVVDHYLGLWNSMVMLDTPDDEFDVLWQWTLTGVDRFWVETPKLGTALTAGYATTAHGWDGRHKVNGRPGYGWYFGRDAVWSAFAIDDYGDFENVREQLRFFSRFQDQSGKIFHELSTSGALHYDAADATPLYVMLAAHYWRASGDTELIEQLWPSLRKAMEFCYTTDTDGDGLIENTQVGHGWVEGGALWGAHSTLYLVGLWAQTLSDAAEMAKALGHTELSSDYDADSRKVRALLNGPFWNGSQNSYNYGKLIDGSYNDEKTMLPAVPMIFDLLDADKCDGMLSQWAGNGYTTNWGMRILSGESPRFHPRSYHGGSVWPLYTGWTALAEYAYGRPVQGFSHLYSNMMIKNHWALGFVEEVMNGSEYRPSGVCPHQCWSETNIAHPVLAGMLGWRPHAPAGSAALSPVFPVNWDGVSVKHLRVGDSRVALTYHREAGETVYKLSLEGGPALDMILKPDVLDGMTVDAVTVDDQPVSMGDQGRLQLRLAGTLEVKIRHHGGMAMVPLLPRPCPGDAAPGPRIVSSTLEGKVCTVDLEGPSGGEAVFQMRALDIRLSAQKGCQITEVRPDGTHVITVRFPRARQPYSSRRIELLAENSQP